MILNVITPTSRPENLPALAESIRDGLRGIRVAWWVIFDPKVGQRPASAGYTFIRFWDYGPGRPGQAGYPLRNFALEKIHSGWLYFLDDDNLIHPALGLTLQLAARTYPDAQWFIFRQLRPSGETYLAPQCPPKLNAVDVGQCVIRRDLYAPGRGDGPRIPIDWRFPEDRRDADGVCFEWLGRLVAPVCVDVPATYYNALR